MAVVLNELLYEAPFESLQDLPLRSVRFLFVKLGRAHSEEII